LAVPLGAQQAAQGPAPDANTSSEGEQQSEPPPHQQSDHIFGVLPNYTTVERDTVAPPITTRQTFRMAALNSFDPYVFPFVAFVAGINQLQDQGASWPRNLSGYGKRYAAALTDNTFGNFMTTAIMPTLLDQDPLFRAGSRQHAAPRGLRADTKCRLTRSIRPSPVQHLGDWRQRGGRDVCQRLLPACGS
jgi:hypothetical protein